MKPYKEGTKVKPRRIPTRSPRRTKSDLGDFVKKLRKRHEKFYNQYSKSIVGTSSDQDEPTDDTVVEFNEKFYEDAMKRYFEVNEVAGGTPRNPANKRTLFFKKYVENQSKDMKEKAKSMIAKRPFIPLSCFNFHFRGLIDTGKVLIRGRT